MMELSDEMLAEISYVQVSQYRTKVMKALVGKVKRPRTIAKDTGIRPTHVSKILGQLKKHDLVECINPEAYRGRIYRLTDKGEKVAENIG